MTPNEIMQYFIDQGWTPMQAAGFAAGTAVGESGGNPGAFNPKDPNGGSSGLFQMNGPRKAAFDQFAGDKAKDPRTQLDYATYELNGPEKGAAARLKSATSLEDAVGAGLHFERPQGFDPNDYTRTPDYSRRLGIAKDLYSQYSGMSTPAAAPPQQGLLARMGIATPPPTDTQNTKQGLLSRLGVVAPTDPATASKGLIDAIKTGNYQGMRQGAAGVGQALISSDIPAPQTRPMQPVEQPGKITLPTTSYTQDDDATTSILKMLGLMK